jgi:DNA-binding response OmpR family regulator
MAKILIVEDDQGTAKQLAQGLTAAGHRCAIQKGGEGVLQLAKQHRPDLLVLDIMLPGISGFQVCRAIRNDEELYRMPILVISAMNSQQEVEHGLAQGADDYVTKPFTMHTFVQRVAALLDANEGAPLTDGVTSLADSLGFRKELQRRLAGLDAFGLVYIEMMRLRPFAKAAGMEARDRALRHLARALQQCGSGFDRQFFAGHLGGGHFMCIVPPQRAKVYCERIEEAWTQHRSSLLESIPANSRDDSPPLELLFCVTLREQDEVMTPAEMMDVVSRIRQLRAAQTHGGIQIDRRHLANEDTPSARIS